MVATTGWQSEVPSRSRRGGGEMEDFVPSLEVDPEWDPGVGGYRRENGESLWKHVIKLRPGVQVCWKPLDRISECGGQDSPKSSQHL